MCRLQQAIRKMHLQEEIGEFQKALTSENKIGTVLPVIEVGNSIPGRRVVAVLERLAKTRGLHRIITTDNRTEFTSRAVDEWAYRNGVKFIVLGMEDAPEVIDSCMAAGASGYLLKWTAGKDLIKAVETVRRGLTYVPDRRAG
ncbi:MAG: ISDet2, transposase putative transposase [Deltaproteobacteria bacterium CSP1-8]|nr:MAG: ISDet2, transposase putative transposase [Deltaproteobacteria bacterium CSP1-8]